MKVSEILQEVRTLHSVSQENMANQLDIPRNDYARLERGERALRWAEAKKIAEFLGISLNQLFALEKGELEMMPVIVIKEIGDDNTIVNVNHFSSYESDRDAALKEAKEKINGLEQLLAEKEKRIESLEREIAGANKVIAILEKNQSA